ncbi:MAG: polysaccharide deacetylase family protein [Inquilinus sp.]|nr:polysaccharide deacetylase family protein [Inquilinus sp.]
MATIYLTFDDGPLAGTDDVIAVLQAKRAKGTLFMVGDHVMPGFRGDLLTAAHAGPYTSVANHSSTHGNRRYSEYYRNPTTVVAGFRRTTETLGISERPVRARLPGRNTWRVGNIVATDPTNGGDSGPAANGLAGDGYRVYGWDLEWPMERGRPAASADQIAARVRTSLSAGRTKKPGHLVLLAHDIMFRASNQDRQKLERLIDLLRGDGHDFAFISGFDGAAAG